MNIVALGSYTSELHTNAFKKDATTSSCEIPDYYIYDSKVSKQHSS